MPLLKCHPKEWHTAEENMAPLLLSQSKTQISPNGQNIQFAQFLLTGEQCRGYILIPLGSYINIYAKWTNVMTSHTT